MQKARSLMKNNFVVYFRMISILISAQTNTNVHETLNLGDPHWYSCWKGSIFTWNFQM